MSLTATQQQEAGKPCAPLNGRRARRFLLEHCTPCGTSSSCACLRSSYDVDLHTPVYGLHGSMLCTACVHAWPWPPPPSLPSTNNKRGPTPARPGAAGASTSGRTRWLPTAPTACTCTSRLRCGAQAARSLGLAWQQHLPSHLPPHSLTVVCMLHPLKAASARCSEQAHRTAGVGDVRHWVWVVEFAVSLVHNQQSHFRCPPAAGCGPLCPSHGV